MKQIILGNGNVSLVDDIDYDFLNTMSWQNIPSRRTSYAAHSIRNKEVESQTIYMHTLIVQRMQLIVTSGFEIDHKNSNGLDNQRENLQVITTVQNQQKAIAHIDNTSGQRGVEFSSRFNKWRARITVNKTRIELGYFVNLEDAIAARKKAEERHYK
jgi:hypothetical protein